MEGFEKEKEKKDLNEHYQQQQQQQQQECIDLERQKKIIVYKMIRYRRELLGMQFHFNTLVHKIEVMRQELTMLIEKLERKDPIDVLFLNTLATQKLQSIQHFFASVKNNPLNNGKSCCINGSTKKRTKNKN
jgi:hypothetical protein